MDAYENMKVFRDGNQLVIVLENAGKELEGMLMSMIRGEIPKAEHLTPPAPIAKGRPDIENMKETSKTGPAKFIQENRRSGDMRTVRLEEESPKRTDNVNTQLDPNTMNYFELRDFLQRQYKNEKLRNILATKYHTHLSFVLNTKSEAELRELVKTIL